MGGSARQRGERGPRARAGDNGKHLPFRVEAQALTGPLRPFPSAAYHPRDALTDPLLDGKGAFAPLSAVGLPRLDLTAELVEAEIVLDPPAQGIPLRDLRHLSGLPTRW